MMLKVSEESQSRWMLPSTKRQLYATLSCYLSVMTAYISSFWLSPYLIPFTSGESQIMTYFQMTSLIAAIELGEAVTSIPAAHLADRFGRKYIILSTGPLSIIVWVISIFTKDVTVLYIVRLVQGFTLGVVEIICAIYIAEIASPKIRGTLSGYFATFSHVGILLVYFIAEYLTFNHFTLTLMAVPLLFCVTFVLMPESPYYYFMIQNKDKAKSSLAWLRYGEDIEEEYQQIEMAVNEDMKNKSNWADLIATKSDRRALLIVLIVTVSRYAIGVGTFIAFIEAIFDKAGQHYFTANQLSIYVALAFAISAFIGTFFSDTTGRRKLLIFSLIGTILSCTIIAIYYYLLEKTDIHVQEYVWFMYIGIIGYCIFTSIGLIQLMPTIKAEYFPSHTRCKGGALSSLTAALVVFAQLHVFPIITDHYGMYVNFIMFGAFAFIGIILVILYVPESAGKSLKEINENIKDITSK